MTHRTLLTAACALAVFACGCSGGPKTRKETLRERQDRALRDPFGYKPDWSDTGISGGGTADLDKDGLGNDLKKVLDP